LRLFKGLWLIASRPACLGICSFLDRYDRDGNGPVTEAETKLGCEVAQETIMQQMVFQMENP